MPTVNVQTEDEVTSEAVASEPTTTEQPAQSAASTTPPAKTGNKLGKTTPSKRVLVEAVLVLLVAALGVYAWSQHADSVDKGKQLSSLKANPQQAVQQQTNDLITSVGKLISLPKGETPTVAAVTDAAQAKKQSAFFNDAQNGDKVLLYVKAGEAILYRPSTNKIILVAPLTFSNTGGTSSNTSTSTTTKH